MELETPPGHPGPETKAPTQAPETEAPRPVEPIVPPEIELRPEAREVQPAEKEKEKPAPVVSSQPAEPSLAKVPVHKQPGFFEADYFGGPNSNYVESLGGYRLYDHDLYWRSNIQAIKRHLPAGQKGSLLEVGCAYGLFLKRATPMFEEVHGLDISQHALDEARKEAPKAILKKHDLDEGIPYPNESFDVVAGFDVFEHTDSLRGSLGEATRVLRPGGLLLISCPQQDTRLGQAYRKIDTDASHVSVPEEGELDKVFDDLGLEKLEQRRFFPLGPIKIPLPVMVEVVLRKPEAKQT
jgi:SAM-dependent methyltransferase